MSRRVVVIGNGMAGFRFAATVADHDPGIGLTIVGAETGGAYNRVLLSNLLAGKSSAADIVLGDDRWYADRGIALHNVAAVSIDRAAHEVLLADGRIVGYDALVIATGSTPVVPPVSGPGVVAFRTLEDCRQIDRLAGQASEAVVVGGGVLGVEAAIALADRGIAVTIVQRGPRLMDRQLDHSAAALLKRLLHARGITVRCSASVRDVVGAPVTTGVVLDDDTEISAGLVVLSCGVRPNTDLARDAGLAVRAGIVVDDQLRSVTDPDVLAIGECAEHRDTIYGLVTPVWEQARVAASTVASPDLRATYDGSTTVTRLKAAGIELTSMGEPTLEAGEDDADADVVTFRDSGHGIYQKLVVHEGRLTGAILLGDTRAAGTISQLYDRGADLPADRASLLIVRRNSPVSVVQSPTLLPGSATICRCNGVTKAGICSAWEGGARALPEIVTCTRATTGCGSCTDTVQGLLEWLAASDPSELMSA